LSEQEEERIAEVALPVVKVPTELRDVINDLKYLKLKGDKIKMYTTSDIVREALLKGLRLMLFERAIYDVIIEKEARAGAERIYASLNKEPVVEKPQAATGVGEALEEAGVKKMEEEYEEEEGEEEEETEE